MKAHVKNGYFVSDEPTELPEGTAAELVVLDAFADMDPEERAELEVELDQGAREFETGDYVDAPEFLTQLQAKNT